MSSHDHSKHRGHAPPDDPAGIVVQVTPGTHYTCLMHPEIRRDQPGTCPKCGMTLEPLMPAPDAARTRSWQTSAAFGGRCR